MEVAVKLAQREEMFDVTTRTVYHIDHSGTDEVLITVAPYLTGELLQQALNLANWIKDHFERVRALAALTPYLSGEAKIYALKEGLAAAAQINNPNVSYRVSALAALAPHLTGELLQQGLEVAAQSDRAYWRVDGLIVLAPYLRGKSLEE